MVGSVLTLPFGDGFLGGCELLVSGSSTITTKELITIPSRELTYPALGKGKSSSKCHFGGICSLEGNNK